MRHAIGLLGLRKVNQGVLAFSQKAQDIILPVPVDHDVAHVDVFCGAVGYRSVNDFGERVPVRIYINRGVDLGGDPMFQDVTDISGMIGLPTKAPHVEIADIDNDGWPDILTTAHDRQSSGTTA